MQLLWIRKPVQNRIDSARVSCPIRLVGDSPIRVSAILQGVFRALSTLIDTFRDICPRWSRQARKPTVLQYGYSDRRYDHC